MEPAVFHADKKPFRRAAFGALGVAALMVAVMIAAPFLGVDGKGLGIIVIGVFAVALVGGLATFQSVLNPMELRVDEGGVEVRARGNTTRIPWDQVDEVRIARPLDVSKDMWLMAWPEHPPMRLPKRMHHPEWKADLAGVKVCDLSPYERDAETIREAVRQAAGSRWNDAEVMR
ncbi:PH domain-containing protein [Actinomadura bangladeshensis]|uniref:Low molecular weight protein antigen 6 PH domain-containing protein n=1 Tax=Actinomadura bangladeshensis TaxID=453573 RepID=A0A4R4NWD1_9ACTN|nr:PH domain-containing protein [Actinomadura bangladeshensis]TDC13799.1 hypothetical protein E1284_18930 [Actinomadura bangladeshensis]